MRPEVAIHFEQAITDSFPELYKKTNGNVILCEYLGRQPVIITAVFELRMNRQTGKQLLEGGVGLTD